MNTSTRHWFGPKLFGWGWRPITWQGWLITLLLITVLYINTRYVPTKLERLSANVVAIIVFVVVSYGTGGRPGSMLRK
jgi:MFS superfamily sulfate permease-like transporter